MKKRVTILDNGVSRDFGIKKFTVREYLYFVDDIVTILCRAQVDGVSNEDTKGLVHGLFQTGEDVNINIGDADILQTIVKLLTASYATADQITKFRIMNTLLMHADYYFTYAGSPVVEKQMSIDATHDITNFTTIYKICWEVAKYNFPFLAKVGKQQGLDTSPTV